MFHHSPQSLLVLLALTLGIFGQAMAAQPAGKVVKSYGYIQAKSVGEEKYRPLNVGDSIFAGDRIRTSRRARVNLHFNDDSRFEIGKSADMVIDKFVYDPDPDKSSFGTRILRGTFRFITGLIAKRRPQLMDVRLTVATIGIRGTHVVGEVEETSATVILLKPEGEDTATSIQVANGFGSVVIDKPGYGTEIPDAYSPPSPVRRMHLRTIKNILRSIRSSHRAGMPRTGPP